VEFRLRRKPGVVDAGFAGRLSTPLLFGRLGSDRAAPGRLSAAANKAEVLQRVLGLACQSLFWRPARLGGRSVLRRKTLYRCHRARKYAMEGQSVRLAIWVWLRPSRLAW
jgi:hypothetical protein